MKTICLFLLFFVGYDINPVHAQSFTLKEAVNFALENNPEVKNAIIDVDLARKKVHETASIGLPNVNGELKYQNFIDIPTQVAPANGFDPFAPPDKLTEFKFGTEQNMSAGLTASQLIFDAKYFLGLKAAKRYIGLTENELELKKVELQNSTTKAYYQALVAVEILKTVSASLQNLKQTVVETTALFANGFVEELDLDQLNITLANLENQVKEAARRKELAYYYLKMIMGMDLKTDLELKDNLENMMEAISRDSLRTEFDLNHHLRYVSFVDRQALVKIDLQKEKRTRLPSLSGFISHSQNAFRNEFNFFGNNKWYPTTVWGFQINVPIFDSYGQQSRINQKKLDVLKLDNQKIQLARNLSFVLESTKLTYSSAIESYLNQKENMKLAEKIKQKSEQKYALGLLSSLELTQVNNQFIAAQTNYYNAAFQALQAKADLEKELYKKTR